MRKKNFRRHLFIFTSTAVLAASVMGCGSPEQETASNFSENRESYFSIEEESQDSHAESDTTSYIPTAEDSESTDYTESTNSEESAAEEYADPMADDAVIEDDPAVDDLGYPIEPKTTLGQGEEIPVSTSLRVISEAEPHIDDETTYYEEVVQFDLTNESSGILSCSVVLGGIPQGRDEYGDICPMQDYESAVDFYQTYEDMMYGNVILSSADISGWANGSDNPYGDPQYVSYLQPGETRSYQVHIPLKNDVPYTDLAVCTDPALTGYTVYLTEDAAEEDEVPHFVYGNDCSAFLSEDGSTISYTNHTGHYLKNAYVYCVAADSNSDTVHCGYVTLEYIAPEETKSVQLSDQMAYVNFNNYTDNFSLHSVILKLMTLFKQAAVVWQKNFSWKNRQGGKA